MKRSEINTIMRESEEFMHKFSFFLPPFAGWGVKEWKKAGKESAEIVENNLGWDITDFGSGNFLDTGLFLFTLRNGQFKNWSLMNGKLYAEKIMIADVDQKTPMHFHWKKMEDIINRGGGNLVIELYNAAPDETLDSTPVSVVMDGVHYVFPAGQKVVLRPGESITLTPYLYHSFWGEGEKVLIGEVSMVNDDAVDNRFLNSVGRFPSIDEDEAPLHLLIGDYGKYYGK